MRLTSATNPESSAISSQYDANGNLMSKTDARSIITTINYDALNRPTSKIYSDSTPAVNYFYDNQTLPSGAPSYSRGSSIGRVVAVTYGGGSLGNYYGYDTLGRVTKKYQRISTTNYQVQASYNLAGAMTSGVYPAGRTISYSFDVAGRLSSFSGTLADGVTRTYASITQYNAAGLKERESYGTGAWGMTTPLYLKLHYNKRQQLVDLRLGSVNDEWNWNRGALIFYYGSNAVSYWNPFQDDTDNNGNVRRALNYVPTAVDGSGNITSYVIPELQDYTYDSLNRIGSVTEAQQNASGAWTFNVDSQTFGYDRYGNRGITAASGGVNAYNPGYNQTTNQITGLGYDTAGNVQSYNGYAMSYDAENRKVSASGAGGSGSYVYDGEGKRVKRVTAGQEWWYIYGIGGELLEEYLSTAPTTVKKQYGYRGGQLLVVWDSAQTGDQAWKWLVQDHLDSMRMESDKSGSLTGMKRHDYLPFGEELTASVGAQRSGVGYEPPASNIRQKFGSKERDFETGLDYFGARYYSSGMGRWTSPDWSETPEPIPHADLTTPQSLNLYTYVYNNPLFTADSDGHSPDVPEWLQRLINAAAGRGYKTDAELEAEKRAAETKRAQEAYKAAEELKKLGFDPDQISQLSNQQVTDLYNALQKGEIPDGIKIEIQVIVPGGTNKPSDGSKSLTKAEKSKLGNLLSRADETVSAVIRSRGGTGANVKEVGHWAEKTLAEAAKAAAKGDATAAKAIKIVKQAGRLGQKH